MLVVEFWRGTVQNVALIASPSQGMAGMAWHGMVCLRFIIRVVILDAVFSKLVRNSCTKIAPKLRTRACWPRKCKCCISYSNFLIHFQERKACLDGGVGVHV